MPGKFSSCLPGSTFDEELLLFVAAVVAAASVVAAVCVGTAEVGFTAEVLREELPELPCPAAEAFLAVLV